MRIFPADESLGPSIVAVAPVENPANLTDSSIDIEEEAKRVQHEEQKRNIEKILLNISDKSVSPLYGLRCLGTILLAVITTSPLLLWPTPDVMQVKGVAKKMSLAQNFKVSFLINRMS